MTIYGKRKTREEEVFPMSQSTWEAQNNILRDVKVTQDLLLKFLLEGHEELKRLNEELMNKVERNCDLIIDLKHVIGKRNSNGYPFAYFRPFTSPSTAFGASSLGFKKSKPEQQTQEGSSNSGAIFGTANNETIFGGFKPEQNEMEHSSSSRVTCGRLGSIIFGGFRGEQATKKGTSNDTPEDLVQGDAAWESVSVEARTRDHDLYTCLPAVSDTSSDEEDLYAPAEMPATKDPEYNFEDGKLTTCAGSVTNVGDGSSYITLQKPSKPSFSAVTPKSNGKSDFTFGIQTNTLHAGVSNVSTSTVTPSTVGNSIAESLYSTQKQEDLFAKFKPKAGSWTCDGCYVTNDAEKDKCPACGGLKPGTKPELSSTSTSTSTRGGFTIGVPTGQASAPQAVLQFGNTTVSFGNTAVPAKPAVKSADPIHLGTGFGDKFKPKCGSWTCDGCYVSNGAEVTACVACGARKPGAQPIKSSADSKLFPSTSDRYQSAPDDSVSISIRRRSEYSIFHRKHALQIGFFNNNPPPKPTGSGFSTVTSKSIATLGFAIGAHAGTTQAGFTNVSTSAVKPSTLGRSVTRPKSRAAASATLAAGVIAPPKFVFTPKQTLGRPSNGTLGFNFGGTSSSPVADMPTSIASKADGISAGASKASDKNVFGGFTFTSTHVVSMNQETEEKTSEARSSDSITASGYTFGTKTDSSCSFASLAAQAPDGGFTLGRKAKGDPSLNWDCAGKSLFHRPTSPGEAEGGDDVKPIRDVYIEPLVQLPEVEVKTGEEDEAVLYRQRAKLYRYMDSQWKELGVGEMKLLKHNVTGRIRVLMRREQVHKLCANHALTAEMELKPMTETAWCWNALDFTDGESKNEEFAIRFKNKDLAQAFKEIFEECQREMSQLNGIQAEGETIAAPSSPEGAGNVGTEESYNADHDAEVNIDFLPLFDKRATMMYGGDWGTWLNVGSGRLLVHYDDDMNGARVSMTTDKGRHVCDHVICQEHRLQCNEANFSCEWTAKDFSTGEPVRQTFRVRFSSAGAVREFKNIFQEGRHLAIDSDIWEVTDRVPPVAGVARDRFEKCSCSMVYKNKDLAQAFKEKFEECQRETSQLNGIQAEGETIAAPSSPEGAGNVGTEESYNADHDAEVNIDFLPLFDKRATMMYGGDWGTWPNVGSGRMLVHYDDDINGARVSMTTDKGRHVCDHVICQEHRLQCNEANFSCEWTAKDFSTGEPVRRTFRVRFSSAGAVREFKLIFQEGRHLARDSDIWEVTDRVPPVAGVARDRFD